MKNCGIYCIENTITNKKYIGSSIELNVRIKKHFYELKRNNHKNPHLQTSFNKYGKDNFRNNVLEICTKDILVEREKHWITSLDTKNKDKGYNMLEPGNCNKGFKQGKELIEYRISKINKKINQYSLDGTFIKKWNSIKEASDFINIHSSGITNCCKRKFRQKTAGGFIWRYLGDNDITINKIVYPKEVYQYDLNNNLIAKYKSIHEASRNTKVGIMSISDCINNKRKSTMNFIFKTK